MASISMTEKSKDRIGADWKRGMLAAASMVRQFEAIGGTNLSLLASDIEDATRWSFDPAECEHPYWDFGPNGTSHCRHCKTDTTNKDGMGD